jgi:hypothetical protein
MSHAFSPNGGAVVLLVPGLIAAFEYVFADPLMIALILLALVLDASQKRRPALVALAAAILVKEIAEVALVTWFWRAWTRRDWRRGAEAAAAVIRTLAGRRGSVSASASGPSSPTRTNAPARSVIPATE